MKRIATTDDRGSYHLGCSHPPYLSGDLRDLAEALAFAPRLLEEMTISATHSLLDAREGKHQFGIQPDAYKVAAKR